ncbi:hypothetical protein [Actinoplanes lobatus]|uniref:Uncharacterized protein n=1 Tax=Actinoplanes lobatus TaxID=113568 RepID=A0A7W7HMF5_9ACTN|nr:hypothetical protein [Actinoplanes lobatus]MBB4753222.1 hypothetical protein [Actinoplanes lobatus]GIE42918.1 hypothetical protein Alo02nite_58160 [Actinoplanes lobatus]
MDLPLHDPLFWARYTFAYEDEDRVGELADQIEDVELDDDDEDIEGVEVVFDVGGGCRLVLDVALELDHHSLELIVPGLTEPAELGWDDLDMWHPHALRWSELDLICRAVDPEPGPALALLCRFAAVFEDDDVDAAAAAVDAAYASLRPEGWTGYWPNAADWLERNDLRGQAVTWHTDGQGRHWATQKDWHQKKDFYSTRQGPDKFPHDELRTLLQAARR